MKIGIIGDLCTATAGGGYTFQSNIISALTQRTNRHEYIIFSDKTFFNDTATVKTVALSKYITKKNDSFAKKIVMKLLRTFETMHAKKHFGSLLNRAIETTGIELFWFITPSFTTINIPYLYTVWDLQHRLQPYFPEVSVTGSNYEQREKHFRSMIPQAAYVIVGNQTAQSEVERFYQVPSERIKIVPMPTPNFTLVKKITHKKQPTLSRPYFFYPAQFWPHKNHVIIIQALKELQNQKLLTFDVVFTGSDKGNEQYIRTMVTELNLTNHVHFFGFVSNEEIIHFYTKALALIFPSFFGPDNIPPLEAFFLQCPVIAADIAGAREQMEDAALFFDPKDTHQLINQIIKIQSDESIRTLLIERGKKLAEKRSTTMYINTIETIIDQFAPIRQCWSNKERYVHQ